jgi:hypothetical protein
MWEVVFVQDLVDLGFSVRRGVLFHRECCARMASEEVEVPILRFTFFVRDPHTEDQYAREKGCGGGVLFVV